MPPDLHNLLVKLEFISKVERGNKINLNDMSIVDSSSWIASFFRSINGEGRRGLIAELRITISSSVRAIEEYNGTEFCRIIVNHLNKARIGISNLSATYQNDAFTLANIDTLISDIDIQLKKNKQLIDGHTPKIENFPKAENNENSKFKVDPLKIKTINI